MINDHDYAHDGQEETATQEQPTTDAAQKQSATSEENNYKENFLRLSADFSNYKRRVEKEREEWMRTAQASVIEKIIPLVSDLERAFDAAEKVTSSDNNTWLEGFRLIEKNLKKTLKELGAEEIESSGLFNPELHEALMRTPSETIPSGSIVQTFNKGYTFKGRVLKHAQVSVAE